MWVPKKKAGEEQAEPNEPKGKGKDKGSGKGKSKGGDKGDKGGEKGGKKGKGKFDDGWGKGYDDWGKGKKGGKGFDKGWDKGKKGGKGKTFDDYDYDGGKGFYENPPPPPPNFKGGEKGKDDRGKGGKGGKGGGKGKGPEKGGGEDGAAERRPRNEDMKRQATAFSGKHCVVKKHSSMGCAIVTMNLAQVREAIVAACTDKVPVAGHMVNIKVHTDKETGADIPTDLFAGWGRQAEKSDPLSEEVLADFFDELHNQFASTGRVAGADVSQAPASSGPQLTQQAQKALAQAQMAQMAQMPGLRPPGPPAGNPMAAMMAQQAAAQQQQQMMAAQYMIRYQQQQAAYYAQAQAVQALQQQRLMQHYEAQQHAQQAAMAQQSGKRTGYKAAYRHPTDDEVREKLQNIGKRNSDAQE